MECAGIHECVSVGREELRGCGSLEVEAGGWGWVESPTCTGSGTTQVHTVFSTVEHVIDAGGREHGHSAEQGAHLDGHTSC